MNANIVVVSPRQRCHNRSRAKGEGNKHSITVCECDYPLRLCFGVMLCRFAQSEATAEWVRV